MLLKPQYLLSNAFIALAFGFACVTSELIDSDDIERFCYPEEHKNTRNSCECSNDSAPPWGMRALRIDCSYKYFKTSDFPNGVLPLYIDTLDLSWNSLERVPVFGSDSLRVLNLMHNNISSVTSKNFIKISNIRELYLNWNSIQVIESNAFDELAHLQVLDLSHNNLQALQFNIFAPLLILESLSLSWNRQLNKTEGIQELDFYDNFGLNRKLRTLKLAACSLASVQLNEKAELVQLDLRRNLMTKLPEKLPTTLEKLDFSDNQLVSLQHAETAMLPEIHELLLEDMPRLETVAENAFVPLKSLQKVSFQNSRRLATFDAHAFGINATDSSQNNNNKLPLTAIIFRGTALRTFNATLLPVFRQLTELDLNGVPLLCDCELVWFKQLPLETQGRCFKPSRLRGSLVTSAREKDFSCDYWPRWVFGLIILCLIFLGAGGIYLIVMGLRPRRGVTMRRKVGVGSPYARVTIEPNRQENNY